MVERIGVKIWGKRNKGIVSADAGSCRGSFRRKPRGIFNQRKEIAGSTRSRLSESGQ